MTTFSTQVDARGSQDEVFEYLATFSNAREWDPGVTEGEALTPGPAAVGSVYRLGVRIAGRVVPFDYRVVDIDRPRGVVLVAQRGHLVSTDTITVEKVGPARGCAIRRCSKGAGAAARGSPLISHVFTKMAERAAAGLRPVGMTPPLVATLVDGALEATVVGSFSRAGFRGAQSRLGGLGLRRRIFGAHHGRDGRLLGHRPGCCPRAGPAGCHALARRPRRGAAPGHRPPQPAPPVPRSNRSSSTSSMSRLCGSSPPGRHAARTAARAGACGRWLFPTYRRGPSGDELTVATAVLAPFRLTWLLSPLLRRAGDATIVTVSSGGMYTQPFDLDRLEMSPGTTGHHRLRPGQAGPGRVVPRVGAPLGSRRRCQLRLHPGWVETPGLASGLPNFARLGPLLRTPAEGADTAVWLAAGGARRADLTELLTGSSTTGGGAASITCPGRPGTCATTTAPAVGVVPEPHGPARRSAAPGAERAKE